MKRDLGEQKAMEKKFSFSKKRLKKQVGPFFFFSAYGFCCDARNSCSQFANMKGG
jgi:hypothetical protein